MPSINQSSSPKSKWHNKIATARGSTWHKNMLIGRREAVLNPSNIRLARLKKEMHQDQLAKRLEMSESTYGAIERGKRPVKTDQAKEIASHLGMPVEKLFRQYSKRHNPRKPSQTKYVAIIQKSLI